MILECLLKLLERNIKQTHLIKSCQLLKYMVIFSLCTWLLFFYQILYFFLKPQKERIILTFPYLSLPIPNAFIVIMHINSLVHALTTNYSGPNRCFICLICYLCQKQVSKQHCQSEPAFRINKIESNIHNNKQ